MKVKIYVSKLSVIKEEKIGIIVTYCTCVIIEINVGNGFMF